MSGTEAIVARILSDAESKASVIISDSENKAEELKQQAEIWREEYLSAQRDLLKKETIDVVSRRKTVAELDCKKIILAAKQEIIDEVLKTVLAKLIALPIDEYLKFVDALIGKYGELGDALIFAENSPLTVENLSKLGSVNDLSIKVQGSGVLNGGVMLTNTVCDKDLTFETLIQEKRSEIEKFVSDSLFTEN